MRVRIAENQQNPSKFKTFRDNIDQQILFIDGMEQLDNLCSILDELSAMKKQNKRLSKRMKNMEVLVRLALANYFE